MNHLNVTAYHDEENFAILITLTEPKDLKIYQVVTVKEKCKPISKNEVRIMFIFVGKEDQVVPRKKFNSINVDGTIVYFDKLTNGRIDSTQIPTGIVVVEETLCWDILANIPKGKLEGFVKNHIECFSSADDTFQTSMNLHKFIKEYLVSNGCYAADAPPQAVGNGGVLRPS